MKASVTLLAVSLAANLGLLGWFAMRSKETPTASQPPAVAAAGKSADAAAKSGPSALTGEAFATLSPAQFRDRLRASGLPENIVQRLVVERINRAVNVRRQELLAEAMKSAPPWRLAALRTDRLSVLTPAQRKELLDLETEARDQILRLLGPSQLDREGNIAFKYGFVSPEKAVLLDALVRDYENMGAQAKEESRFLKTPADRERDKFLRAEQDRDLAALLTPEEREAFELRASTTALNSAFQARIAAFQPTEAEYRALFALQKAADERAAAGIRPGEPAIPPRPPGNVMGATMISMSGSSQVSDDAARAALGETRFAEWQEALMPHFQTLARQAATNAISRETVKAVSALLTETTNTSWQIASDQTMDVAQKKAAMVDLAATTRTQVTAKLGASVAEPYLKSIRWFEGISAGTAVQVNGNTTYFRSVETPVRPLPPGGGARG